jgi:transcriptional regulator with XRE-family HTH domain
MPREHDYLFLAEIGRRLAERREQLGLSQPDLASKVKISHQMLSRYELGQSDPPMSTFMRICSALGISPTPILVQVALLSEQDKTP